MEAREGIGGAIRGCAATAVSCCSELRDPKGTEWFELLAAEMRTTVQNEQFAFQQQQVREAQIIGHVRDIEGELGRQRSTIAAVRAQEQSQTVGTSLGIRGMPFLLTGSGPHKDCYLYPLHCASIIRILP